MKTLLLSCCSSVLFFFVMGLIVLFLGCSRLMRLIGSDSAKTPPMDPFYTYSGFRDWYRFPLKYPYEVDMADVFDHGYLEKFEGGNIEEGNSSTSVCDGWITALHLHEDYAFFRREDSTYGYLQYSTGEIRFFKTEEELKQSCLLTPDDFKSLEYYYKLFEKGTILYPPDAAAKSPNQQKKGHGD